MLVAVKMPGNVVKAFQGIKVWLIQYPPQSGSVEMQKTIIGGCRGGIRKKQVAKDIAVLGVEWKGQLKVTLKK